MGFTTTCSLQNFTTRTRTDQFIVASPLIWHSSHQLSRSSANPLDRGERNTR
ncbi:hypothetical protein CY34DRAFT_797650 [Suillus luteus UH-Slu-Lm8-n1]|uniref:Uncharacterized protein n=1 Tax=Suillus luteus UH-Slu-Lm8-n1 TaxID=930992 RepID=A0A0D0AF71_9AGAM|nr:hypothetical protein CY34DRAFT_797650 [Suillus luteus UH-Slu-Lm8-n1]